MKIRIATRWIGENSPVFIIAEGGINHNGNIKIAKQLIIKAKESGADAIKFQTFKAEDLASPKSRFFKVFRRTELSYEEFGELSDFAKSNKIIFFSTPFSNDAVDLLSRLNAPAFKIASGDLTNIPLIKYVATKNKPVIISTGMADINDVKYAVRAIRSTGNNKIIIMHSVSAYPTPLTETNLSSISQLSKVFPYPIGYSDNGKNLLVPLIAVAVGAKIIEKHLIVSKKSKSPDSSISATPSQFKMLIKNMLEVKSMLGDGNKHCQPSELENRINARRSITASVAIKKGTKLTMNMIKIQRPATGIPPMHLHKVIGKKTRKNIEVSESIKWSDLK